MNEKKRRSLKLKNSGKKLMHLGYLLLILAAFLVSWVPSAIAANIWGFAVYSQTPLPNVQKEIIR